MSSVFARLSEFQTSYVENHYHLRHCWSISCKDIFWLFNDAWGLFPNPFTERIENNLRECFSRFQFPYKCRGRTYKRIFSPAATVITPVFRWKLKRMGTKQNNGSKRLTSSYMNPLLKTNTRTETIYNANMPCFFFFFFCLQDPFPRWKYSRSECLWLRTPFSRLLFQRRCYFLLNKLHSGARR